MQQTVGKHHGLFQTAFPKRRVDQARNLFLLQGFVQVAERQSLGQNFRQEGTPCRRLHHCGVGDKFATLFVLGPLGETHIDLGGQLHHIGVQSALDLADIGKDHAFASGVDALASRVVKTQHHVLRGHNGRLTVGGEKHIVGSEHQGARFHLGLHRQGDVNGHLVAVKVGIEGRAHQGVQLNGFAFNQNGLKRLDAQTVQGGGAVEHHGMLFDHFLQNVPHHRRTTLDLFLGRFDGRGNAHGLQTREDEGLEELQGHQFGQTTLVQFERWAHGDHRAS